MARSSSDEQGGGLAKFGVSAGPRFGEEIAVPSPVASIGSGTQNEMVLPDDSVSKVHARLEFVDGAWRLTDLNSTNGTFVEGVRLAAEVPTPLQYGNTVRFGGIKLQFREVEAADPSAARETYAPPPPPERIRDRSRTRFPVWVVALALLVILLAVLFFAGVFTGGTEPTSTTVGAVEATLEIARSMLAPLPVAA
jgi:pSer/pThr/pTyr-binding forkhead associated (FHA) protein